MTNAPSSRKPRVSSKCLYLGIFVQIRRAGILYVVIKTDNDLLRIVNPRGSHRSELGCHWRGVVVGHTVLWTTSNVVATLNELSFREVNGVALYDLFRESLRQSLLGGCSGSSECRYAERAGA